MQTPINSELPPDYYLSNFKFMLNWVVQRYEDLLSDAEKSFIERFLQLNHTSQCLLVRLSSRKGPLFRAEKLRYAEIESISMAAAQLIAADLLQQNPVLSVSELADSVTKAELFGLFKTPLASIKNERKEIWVQHLLAVYSEPKPWLEWTQGQFGEVFRLDNQSIISTLLLLFFGNPYQDLTEFVLQDLGLFRYEQYNVDPQHRIFKSRDELQQYRQLIDLREQLELAETPDEIIQLAQQLPADTLTDSLERRRAKLNNQIAYELERIEQHELAYQLYSQVNLAPARERRIRLLEKRGDYANAWLLLNELMLQPSNEHELQIAERIKPRLAKKLGEPIAKKQLPQTQEQTLKLAALQDEFGNFLRVEEVARLAIDSATAPCFYAENLLINGLFGLWLWPEMFRGVEGAFANPFQTAPLDMYQESFVKNRPGMTQLWSLFNADEHTSHIRSIYHQKYGIANQFVNWQFLDEALLNMALQCIDAHHLKAIFERLLFDIQANRSGLPDLIQFFPGTNSCRMIEVKGPGDRLQDNQLRWLSFFSEKGIPAEVCYVCWE